MARLAMMTAAVVFIAGACASATTIDHTQLIADVPRAVSPGSPGDVTNVVCPEDIARGEGLTVTCTAELGADPIRVVVRQVDSDGAVELTVTEELIELGPIEAAAQDRFLTELALDATVVCEGSRLRVLGDGVELACVASTGPADDVSSSESAIPADRPFAISVAADGTYGIELG